MTTKADSAGVPGTGVVTRLLIEMRQGDPEAAGELWSQVYPDRQVVPPRGRVGEPLFLSAFHPGPSRQGIGDFHQHCRARMAFARAWLFREIQNNRNAPS